MLSKIPRVRVALQKGKLQDWRKSCCVLQERWRSSGPAAQNSELAYMSNPGNRTLLDRTIGQMLESAAENWPDRECVVSVNQGARLTYGELLQRADRLAAGLKKIGLREGDRIGIWGPNQLEWLLSFTAATRLGLIVAGINPGYQQSELLYCIEKIGMKAVIAPRSYKTWQYPDMLLASKKLSSSLEHIIISSDDHIAGTRRLRDIEDLASKKDVEVIKEEQAKISPYCGANIQFTSGTTGKPKAALLSHKSIVNNARQAVTRLDTDGRKICLNVPYFHVFGLIMGIVGPLQAGSTVVLENPTFNPVKSIEAILKEKCSVCFGTPTMWTNMIDVQIRTGSKIDTLYTGTTGGAPASPEFYRRIRKHLRLEQIKTIYGLTETTCIVNQSLPDEAPELTENTVGYISDNIEMKVIDDDGNIVPFGTPGELCVKGYCTMMGYWADEKNTRETLNEDGWLRTGDQYILRKDGYGQIVGRLKDMLIRGGENIFPKEIEHFLETHPEIIEAHAFGVHDDVYGEEICACIKLRTGAKMCTEDIIKFAKGKIAHFKIPRYIEFRDDFPKTSSGKIQKFKLKEELEERGFVPKRTTNNKV